MKEELLCFLESYSDEEINQAYYDELIDGLLCSEAKERNKRIKLETIEENKKPKIFDPNVYHRYSGYAGILTVCKCSPIDI